MLKSITRNPEPASTRVAERIGEPEPLQLRRYRIKRSVDFIDV